MEAGCSAGAGSGGLLVECTETSRPRGGSLQSNSKRHYPRQRAGTEQSLDLTGQTLSVEDVSYIPAVLLPVVIVHVKCCTSSLLSKWIVYSVVLEVGSKTLFVLRSALKVKDNKITRNLYINMNILDSSHFTKH